MHHTDWNGGMVALFHRFDRYALVVGSAVSSECSTTHLRMGIDGIFSDWVDRMMEAYRAEIGSGP